MTINEAIAELTVLLEVSESWGLPAEKEAIRLGIEALKAVKHNRHAFIIDYQVTLPGETK